jgi:hypothetical protein
MKGTVKGRSGIVVGGVALAVAGFSVASSLARRIGVVEPKVIIERGAKESEAAQAAMRLRLQIVKKAMDGEVATTADRLREAAALAAAASLVAANERGATAAKGWNLLQRVAARNLLPPGAAFSDQSNMLATPHGSLILRFRSMPLGVEVLSIGKDKTAGPALIIRVAGDIPGADGLKVWMATTLDRASSPRPFADESEVIAAGWQAETLAADR